MKMKLSHKIKALPGDSKKHPMGDRMPNPVAEPDYATFWQQVLWNQEYAEDPLSS